MPPWDTASTRSFGPTRPARRAQVASCSFANARAFADEQLATWARLAGRVGQKERVLAISHGGIIELPIVALADELGIAIDGPSFANLQGARITYDRSGRTKLELLR